jgi:ribonucleoside-triphosphate reductase
VVSGEVRQTAEIAFGEPDSTEYIDLKDYVKNPQRAAYGWTRYGQIVLPGIAAFTIVPFLACCSNNSVYAKLGMDYSEVAKRIRGNGEPGFAWLENMKKYVLMSDVYFHFVRNLTFAGGVRRFSRMVDPCDDKDHRAKGGNPCLEQTLESYELCCLVETFPANHADLEDFKRTLKVSSASINPTFSAVGHTLSHYDRCSLRTCTPKLLPLAAHIGLLPTGLCYGIGESDVA